MIDRIALTKLHSGNTCYTDYEELAFMNMEAKWLETLFASMSDIGGVFFRDRPNKADLMDVSFYAAIHFLNALGEEGVLEDSDVANVVETACYTVDLLTDNNELVRSGIDWNKRFPNNYEEWVLAKSACPI